MKSVVTVLTIAFLFLSIIVSAQSRVSQQEKLKNLRVRPNLTEEQYAKVEQILINSYDEMLKLRSPENPDREEFRKIRDESNREIMQILDEKQKAGYNKMLDMRRNFQQHDSNNKIK
jgi:hypothetical protein